MAACNSLKLTYSMAAYCVLHLVLTAYSDTAGERRKCVTSSLPAWPCLHMQGVRECVKLTEWLWQPVVYCLCLRQHIKDTNG